MSSRRRSTSSLMTCSQRHASACTRSQSSSSRSTSMHSASRCLRITRAAIACPAGLSSDEPVLAHGQQAVALHAGHRLGHGRPALLEPFGDPGPHRRRALLLELEDRAQVHLRGVDQITHLGLLQRRLADAPLWPAQPAPRRLVDACPRRRDAAAAASPATRGGVAVIVWFRRDLRLADHGALRAAGRRRWCRCSCWTPAPGTPPRTRAPGAPGRVGGGPRPRAAGSRRRGLLVRRGPPGRRRARGRGAVRSRRGAGLRRLRPVRVAPRRSGRRALARRGWRLRAADTPYLHRRAGSSRATGPLRRLHALLPRVARAARAAARSRSRPAFAVRPRRVTRSLTPTGHGRGGERPPRGSLAAFVRDRLGGTTPTATARTGPAPAGWGPRCTSARSTRARILAAVADPTGPRRSCGSCAGGSSTPTCCTGGPTRPGRTWTGASTPCRGARTATRSRSSSAWCAGRDRLPVRGRRHAAAARRRAGCTTGSGMVMASFLTKDLHDRLAPAAPTGSCGTSSTATSRTTASAGSGSRAPAWTRRRTTGCSTRSCRACGSTPTATTCAGTCRSCAGPAGGQRSTSRGSSPAGYDHGYPEPDRRPRAGPARRARRLRRASAADVAGRHVADWADVRRLRWSPSRAGSGKTTVTLGLAERPSSGGCACWSSTSIRSRTPRWG